MKLPAHIQYQVDEGCPLTEALAQAVCEALESRDQEFLALEYLRQLAELNHPGTVVRVITGPRAPVYADLPPAAPIAWSGPLPS